MKINLIKRVAFLTGAGLLLAGPASGRAWYVNISGTGDVPTIAAALDSAVTGDSVVVGPGHYEIEDCLTVGAGVILISEMGPLQTRISGIGAAGPPPCVVTLGSSSEVNGLWMETSGAATVFDGTSCRIYNNIIAGGPGDNVALYHLSFVQNNLFLAPGEGIYVSTAGRGSIFVRNIVLCRFQCETDPPNTFCNDFAGPDTPCLQAILTVYDPDVNFVADPEFCGIAGSGNYYLQADSPCAPGNTPLAGDCGLIGPLPVGCGPVKTQPMSWGAVKAIYK